MPPVVNQEQIKPKLVVGTDVNKKLRLFYKNRKVQFVAISPKQTIKPSH